jgi:diguanylate cyclase (GGDEF)-like protein
MNMPIRAEVMPAGVLQWVPTSDSVHPLTCLAPWPVRWSAGLPYDAPPALAPGLLMGDWNELLGAVKARLRLSVGDPPPAAAEAVPDVVARGVRTSVLECAAALDQLHLSLRQELGRLQRLELEMSDARAALAQARAELAGMQAGERAARHLALHDGLTALPNRDFFRQQLDRALNRADGQHRPLALLYIDLDAFKPINDTHGHGIGDELLRIIAARLNRAVRANDSVGRMGGDEFACLITDLPGRGQIERLACKLFDAVSMPVMVGDLRLCVRPSIGIALCPADGTTPDTLLVRADAAMYRAKREGCGHAFFDRGADAASA